MSISLIDMQTPFDPTAYTSISGAQLEQLVAGASPYTDKGMILVSSDDFNGNPEVPRADQNTKWQNYIWIRKSSTAATPYVWNANAATDATFYKWRTVAAASIGINTITNAMIVDSAITDSKIAPASLDWNKIYNKVALVHPDDAVSAGDLQNSTYNNLLIKDGAVTNAKLDTDAVYNVNVKNNAITVSKLTGGVADGVAGDYLKRNANGAAPTWSTPNLITNLANPTVIGDVGKVVTVANPYTNGFITVPTTSVGRIIQRNVTKFATPTASSGNLTLVTGLPNYSATGMTALFNSGSLNITTGSKVLVKLTSPVFTGTTNAAYVLLGIAKATGAVAIDATTVIYYAGTSTIINTMTIEYEYTGLTGAQTFYAVFGTTASTAYVNSDGVTARFGASSTMIVEEYI